MKKRAIQRQSQTMAARDVMNSSAQAGFAEVLGLIETARTHAVAAVNTVLIDLYWSIGRYISRRVAQDGWGQGTVTALADYIRQSLPNVRGFSSQNLWRMRQFFDMYQADAKLSALLRELPWTHNLAIMSCDKRNEEREFYLREEVVEYALSRSASPAIVADYQTRLPDKQLLQAKLHEFYESAQSQAQAQKHVSAQRTRVSVKPGKRNK